MQRTAAGVRACLERFGEARFQVLAELALAGEPDEISGALIAAIGIRESNLLNTVGDEGHGRGAFQIDDRAHRDTLRGMIACDDDSWTPVGVDALLPDRVPALLAGASFAIGLLRGNRRGALANGVEPRHALQVSLAAYNAGLGHVLYTYRRDGIRGVDARTTGKDYSADVLVLRGLVNQQVRALGWV